MIFASLAASSCGYTAELCLQSLVFSLIGYLCRPVQREIEMAATVVQFADFARRRFVVFQQFADGAIERPGDDAAAGIVGLSCFIFNRYLEGEELAERIPTQMALLEKLLNVFRRGTACSCFVEPTPLEERDNREHLRAGAQFEESEIDP